MIEKKGGESLRTIEEGCAVVEIVAWPEDKPWEGRYQTTSSIERGICRLVLSSGVFHDAAKANTAYRRFAGKISRAGLVPPRVEFRNFISQAAQRMFCILTTKESIFNSGCPISRMYILQTGEAENRRVCAVLLDDMRETEEEEIAG